MCVIKPIICERAPLNSVWFTGLTSLTDYAISIHQLSGAPNDNFRKNICSEDDLRSRIFGTFVVKFLACLPLLGFSNIYEMV